MAPSPGEVLVALATPWGRSALALIRWSGPGCHAVVGALVRPHTPTPLRPGRVRRVDVLDGDGVVDDGLVWLASGPRTATGEDTAELTVHGNPLVVERVLRAAVAAGAQLAGPGAFTRRAVEHGRLDLVEAEGVQQLVDARSAAGLAVARAALDGRLGAALARLRVPLVEVVAELEARLDAPDDALALRTDEELIGALDAVAAEAEALVRSAPRGRVLVHGARVALVGAVNAGKSSLFNALVGRPRALVHATPGTTRDVVEAPCLLGEVAVTLLDTAGERVTDDPVEAAGLALAAELVAEADLLVVVLRARPEGPDATERTLLARTAGRPRLVVLNGVDAPHADAPEGALPTVAPRGEGVPAVAQAIARALVGEVPGEARLVVASARQAELLGTLARQAREGTEALGVAGPAAAADAVVAGLEALDALTGADTREEVLDALFARFCIGK
ncbi:MAG: 50S ribosome-binding GTPase [Alphaproteobacteria bacterium]|nr:50S ribosome-binding GTPase [Alphaproteobacteria bacterium]